MTMTDKLLVLLIVIETAALIWSKLEARAWRKLHEPLVNIRAVVEIEQLRDFRWRNERAAAVFAQVTPTQLGELDAARAKAEIAANEAVGELDNQIKGVRAALGVLAGVGGPAPQDPSK